MDMLSTAPPADRYADGFRY